MPCAEFNLDVSGATAVCDYVFQVTMNTAAEPWKHAQPLTLIVAFCAQGKAGELLPFALGVEEEVQQMLASQ